MASSSRRAFLESIGAGAGLLLFDGSIAHAALTGAPGRINLSLIGLTDNLLQISLSPVLDPIQPDELGVTARPSGPPLLAAGPVQARSIAWGKYRIEILENPSRVRVTQGTRLRQEIRFDLNNINPRFSLGGAPIYGLGGGSPVYDQRGATDLMRNGQQPETLYAYGARLPIPWVISPLGWGIYVGQPTGDFVFSQTEGMFRAVEATSIRNIYLALGDTPADVLREYAALTGLPHLPPLWSLGYQQSHRTLASEDEILGVAKSFREKKLPCDALIYLGTGFCPSGWNTGHGSFTFNEKVFPDPAATIGKLHAENFKVIVHTVPAADFAGGVRDGNAPAPATIASYWQKHLPLAEAGVDGFWPDEGDRLSSYTRVQRNRMYWEDARRSFPDKRPFALHRNGYAGIQRYGWIWSGDVNADWKALQAQPRVGAVAGLSGMPWWGTDTGGFWATPELSPELYVRWFQFSAFCPLFRSHGRTWKLRLPWGWNLGTAEPKEDSGPWVAAWPRAEDMRRTDVEEICRKYLNLRYQLLPWLYSEVAQTHRTGLPLMRALWLMHPQDARALTVEDCYYWGGAFLVAPVTENGARQKTHYLPPGIWWDYWNNARLEGGRDITRDADLATLPLYVKAGAIVPLGPVKQTTGALLDQPVTLTVYPGADGRFTWYEDDGASFRHESGEFMRVECAWNDAARTLTLTRDAAGRLGRDRKFSVQLKGGRTVNASLSGEVTTVRL